MISLTSMSPTRDPSRRCVPSPASHPSRRGRAWRRHWRVLAERSRTAHRPRTPTCQPIVSASRSPATLSRLPGSRRRPCRARAIRVHDRAPRDARIGARERKRRRDSGRRAPSETQERLALVRGHVYLGEEPGGDGPLGRRPSLRLGRGPAARTPGECAQFRRKGACRDAAQFGRTRQPVAGRKPRW